MKLICNTKKIKSLEFGKDYSECIYGYKSGKKSILWNGVPYIDWKKVKDITEATVVTLYILGCMKSFSLKNFLINN